MTGEVDGSLRRLYARGISSAPVTRLFYAGSPQPEPDPRVLADVLVNHEALMFRGGRILLESFVTGSRHARHYDRPSRFGWFLVKNHWLRRGEGEAHLERGVWAIDNFSPDNYYHWMIDVLPRVLRAEDTCPNERVLVLPRYYGRQSYIPFTLQAFPCVERVHWIAARRNTRVARLVFVPRQTGARLARQLREIAQRVADIAGPPGTVRRLYFTREDAPRRRARNEADLVRELRAHGFEVIRIDPVKPWAQVRAAAGANLIVGVHGAALTNLMFMAPGSCVLELRQADGPDCYRVLAENLGVRYRDQICEVAGDANDVMKNNLDIVVDLDCLREQLATLA